MNQELYDKIQARQKAALFHAVDGTGQQRIVNAPRPGSPIASSFERLGRFADTIVEIGRLGIHETHDVCWGLDVVTDGLDALDQTRALMTDGAIAVRQMAGGRC